MFHVSGVVYGCLVACNRHDLSDQYQSFKADLVDSEAASRDGKFDCCYPGLVDRDWQGEQEWSIWAKPNILILPDRVSQPAPAILLRQVENRISRLNCSNRKWNQFESKPAGKTSQCAQSASLYISSRWRNYLPFNFPVYWRLPRLVLPSNFVISSCKVQSIFMFNRF